jgi:peptide deformylase
MLAPMPDLLHILRYPDPFLKRKARPVEKITAEVRDIADRLVETMFVAHGLGLAATQCGLDMRMAVVSGKGERGDEIVVINPKVVDAWGSEALEEGCLSFPGVAAVITRRKGVRVSYTGLDGKEHEVESETMLGRCCLHELDHLDGITFLAKMTPADKLANRRALRSLEERFGDEDAA